MPTVMKQKFKTFFKSVMNQVFTVVGLPVEIITDIKNQRVLWRHILSLGNLPLK